MACTDDSYRINIGSTINGLLSSTDFDLDSKDFFLLFYVDRLKFVKINKSDMIKVEANKYSWKITSEISKTMNAGKHIGEVAIENSDVIILKFEAFTLLDNRSKTKI